MKNLTTKIIFLTIACANINAEILPLNILLQDISLSTPNGSMSPFIRTSRSNITTLNWLEPFEDGHKIVFTTFENKWAKPKTVTSGDNWFINWADFPSVINLKNDKYAAHWLVKSGSSNYAYDTYISLSNDKGKRWSKPIKAHNDQTHTEHGFVSLYENNGLGFIYLDGRKMANEITENKNDTGMTLRGAKIDQNLKLTSTQLIDGLVCECCLTDVTETDKGPIGIYRNRSKNEIRDIYITRINNGSWEDGKPLHLDNWKIAGCPVNGPSIHGNDKNITVGWFTGANNTPMIKVAKSHDYGFSFAEPIKIGVKNTVGHLSLTVDKNKNTWIFWQRSMDRGAVELVLTMIENGSNKIFETTIEKTRRTPRFSFPQITSNGNNIILAWTAINDSVAADRESRSQNNKTFIKSAYFKADIY